MLKVSGHIRSRHLIDALNEAGTNYAYVDDPGVRWIIDIAPYHRGQGHIWVYTSDKTNVSEEYGSCFFGYQDTVRTIIYRANTHKTYLDEPICVVPFTPCS